MNNNNLHRTWFHQDGVSPHFTDGVIQLLNDQFKAQVISRNGTANGHKNQVIFFLSEIKSVPELKNEIICAIGEMTPELYQNVNFNKRVEWTSLKSFVRLYFSCINGITIDKNSSEQNILLKMLKHRAILNIIKQTFSSKICYLRI